MFKIKDAWQIVEAPPADEGTWVDARDGQVYTWKKLGTQIWMTQNFNYGGKSGDWVNTPNAQSEGHAYRFQNQQDYGDYEAQGWTFGAYYTLASLEWAVPDGWHVPTRDEINTLKTWAMETYGSGASGNVTAQMLGNAALMNSCSNLWSSYGLKVPANKHNLTGFNLCINTTGWSGSGWGYISTPGGYNFTNGSRLWLADSNGSLQYYLNISEDSQYSYSGPSINISSDTPGNKALPIRLIKDAEVSTAQPIITNIVTSLDSTGSDNKLATEKATRSAITSAVSSKMSNPMTTAGDIIVGGASGAPTAVGKASSDSVSVLSSSNSSNVGWQSVDQDILGFDPATDNHTLFYMDAASTTQQTRAGEPEQDTPTKGEFKKITIGTAGQVLKINGSGVPEWANESAGGMTNPMTTNNDLIIGGNSGAPTRLAAGTSGQVLKVGSSGLEWANESGGMVNPMTSAKDMIVGGSSGAPTRLGAGSPGQVLQVGINGITWDDEAIVSISDTDSIGLTIDQNGDLTADLKIDSSAPGNVQLSVSSNGLKGSFDETVKSLFGMNPIGITNDVNDEYTVSLAVSDKPGNKVEIVDDLGQDSPGIYVPTPELDGIITTEGDLVVGGASGVPEALSAGAEGKFLKITSGVPAWGDGLYLGAFSSSNRPQNATTGQYIMDTDLGYFVYKYGDTWINVAGYVVEGTPDLAKTKLFKIRDAWQIGDNIQSEGVWTDVRDGQVYPYKQFGNQIWMTVNFNYGGAENEFVSSTTGQSNGHAWRFNNVYDYNNFESQDGWSLGAYYTSGALDNWVVPTGWHLPSMDEVNQLISWATAEYGNENNALTALATDTTWWGPTRTGIDENLLNESTFNLSPCSYCSNGSFNSMSTTKNNDCHIWTGEMDGSYRYYFKVGLNNSAGYTMKKEFTKTVSSFAFPIRLVSDLTPVAQPVVNSVSVTINDTPSDNKLLTEKAVKDYVDAKIPTIETFPLSLVNNCQPSGTFDNNMNLTKTYATMSRKVSKMGFFHKSGTRGTMGLGIYTASGKLLASTAMSAVTAETEGHICWIDLTTPIELTKGTDYWFAMVRSFNGNPDWSSNINFGHNTTITGCTNSISIQYYLSAQPVTTMPAVISATTEGAAAIWIVAD